MANAKKLCRNLSEMMLKNTHLHLSASARFSSKKSEDHPSEVHFNDQQATYYTAKDIEFSPNRAREVMQNQVVEASQSSASDDPFQKGKKYIPSIPMSDEDHVDAYKSGNSVSLHSVMQSNVPDPFTTRDKAPTHLNMPGSNTSQGVKYLSGLRQKVHQSKQ